MQLKIVHHLNGEELRLPLGYHHIVQSAIYNCVGRDDYSAFLHDGGYSLSNRNYKMFTFGELSGRYSIDRQQRKIVFSDNVALEVRSVEARLIEQVAAHIKQQGITYIGKTITDLSVQICDETVEGTQLVVNMLSPICVYSTDLEQGQTRFYSPEDEEFAYMINESFARKYEAYCGVEPEGNILLRPLRVTDKDRIVTKYKGFYITAWKGIYLLEGRRKYLDFLYQTGLGSKTSQGFGMFDIEASD